MRISGTLTSVSTSASVALYGDYTVSLSGFGTGTVVLQRSFDQGVTWKDVESFTANVEKNGSEPLSQVLYRLNCTAYTSGTLAYTLGNG
jgi:hypothetical protein